MHRIPEDNLLHVFFSRFGDYLKVNSPSSQHAVTHPPGALPVLHRKDLQLSETVWIKAMWPS